MTKSRIKSAHSEGDEADEDSLQGNVATKDFTTKTFMPIGGVMRADFRDNQHEHAKPNGVEAKTREGREENGQGQQQQGTAFRMQPNAT